MTENTVTPLDENTRRYYLDVMGIQCWQLLDAENLQPASDETLIENNRDVTSVDVAADADASINVRAQAWPQLENAIKQCSKCQLCNSRKQVIVGRGSQSAELMFVLLSPNSGDDETGAICSGEAGELFSKMLTAINISINDVYITSLLKCSVPTNHTVSPKEIQSCNEYLKHQIQLIRPKLLVVLGETAIRCLLQKTMSLDDYRAKNAGSQYQVESVPLFVSYSPQELLQQAENKRKAWSDLQQLQKLRNL